MVDTFLITRRSRGVVPTRIPGDLHRRVDDASRVGVGLPQVEERVGLPWISRVGASIMLTTDDGLLASNRARALSDNRPVVAISWYIAHMSGAHRPHAGSTPAGRLSGAGNDSSPSSFDSSGAGPIIPDGARPVA